MLNINSAIANIIIYVYICTIILNINNMDDFDIYGVNIDTECLHQDFDDVDLYGTKMVEDESDEFSNNIEYE